MRFKDYYITEKSWTKIPHWSTTTADFLLGKGRDGGYIPLTQKQIEKAFKPRRELFYHVTDVKGAIQLKKMEGTKRSLSAGQKLGKQAMTGIQTKGGVLVIIEGVPLLKSAADIMSKPDEQGRRWVPLLPGRMNWASYPIDDKYGKKIYDYIERTKKNYLKRIRPDVYKWMMEENDGEYWNGNHGIADGCKDHPSLTDKELGTFIGDVIKLINKKVIHHKWFKDWAEAFTKSSLVNGDWGPSVGGWDESVVGDIKVKRAWVYDASPGKDFPYGDDAWREEWNRLKKEAVKDLKAKKIEVKEISKEEAKKIAVEHPALMVLL